MPIKHLLLGCCLLAVTACSYAQTASTIVTVQRKPGNNDAVPRENVLVFEAGQRAPITVWTPFTGDHASLQLLILLDDSSASGLANELADIRTFIRALPSTTQVGVGYMENGHAAIAQKFTPDHELAARAIRIPQGIRGGGSAFFTLSDVTSRWPTEVRTGRREILMITDGVDRYADSAYDPDNPYVMRAIHDAQRAAIPVYAIYYRGAGRLDSNPAVASGGQNYLAQVTNDTGGRCLYCNMGNPVSLSPLLDELAKILDNQYELVFKSHAKPQNGLVQLKLKMESRGIKLVAPTLVPVTQ